MPLPTHDTLNEFFAADSLAGTADSLLVVPVADTLPAIPAEVWDAVAVYGPASRQVGAGIVETATGQTALTGNAWFQIVILIALGLYCFMIYYYREQVLMCLKGLVNFKSEDKFTAEYGHLYNRFIAFAVILSTLSIGIGLTKASGAVLDASAVEAVPGWIPPLASLLFWALAVLVLTVQTTTLKGIGELTFTPKFTARIIEAKNTHLAAAALFVMPAILLWSGLNPLWDKIVVWIIAAEASVLAVSFLFRTFLLFVRQKVSLLIWFLYLCAVEIFPIALFRVLVVKNF